MGTTDGGAPGDFSFLFFALGIVFTAFDSTWLLKTITSAELVPHPRNPENTVVHSSPRILKASFILSGASEWS